jgi:hypothetical protein
LFPEPKRFAPERWSSIQPGAFEYFPFGAGPRSCLGFTLGMTIIKISLAMILQRFRLSVIPNTRIDRLVKMTLSPKRGISMRIHKKDRHFESAPVRGNIHQMVDLTQADSQAACFPFACSRASGPARTDRTYRDAA